MKMKLANLALKYGKWICIICILFSFATLSLMLKIKASPYIIATHAFCVGVTVASALFAWFLSFVSKEFGNGLSI